MSTRATGRHTRPKKLNAKQNVQIFREDQVDQLIDFDTGRGAIETGVEKAEESVCPSVPKCSFGCFFPTFSRRHRSLVNKTPLGIQLLFHI